MENYQEAFELREAWPARERAYQKRIDELTAALQERDATIARLRLEHRKQFKANRVPPTPGPGRGGKPHKRGAPLGHRYWERRPAAKAAQIIDVPAPGRCPFCDGADLEAMEEVYEHDQEDIVLNPAPRATRHRYHQCWCRRCRRAVRTPVAQDLPGCQIGPLTRAVAVHLRYQLQIPYRKVRHILQDLFGMPLVPASAMRFDRRVSVKGLGLYEELRVKLQSSSVVHADETHWREDGKGCYLWYGGHENLAFFQITPDRSSQSALQLLGEEFDGTLVSDAYAAYNAVQPRHWQSCWAHLNRRAEELLEQIRLTEPPIRVPASESFLKRLGKLGLHLCDLGRQLREGKLKRAKAGRMVPALQRRLRRLGHKPLDYAPAEVLRQRVLGKDFEKLFTFLQQPRVEPTNNQAERSLRPHVIMRKICGGTRSPAGSLSHAVLPSLLETARRQGKAPLPLLMALLTGSSSQARQALFKSGP
jgi:hypothetical protein